MVIIFPSYPGDFKKPDPFFTREYRAAKDAGFDVALVDTEVHFGGEVHVRGLRDGEPCLYRGWLMKEAIYEGLYAGLQARGSTLLVSPSQYLYCYHFPNWYPPVAEKTARSIWFEPGVQDLDLIASRVAEEFGDNPVMLKDYVKSRKEDWFEACYIPTASYAEGEVKRVTANFLNIVGENLVGGLVYREFLSLRRVGTHPKSHMPLVNEHRVYVFKGKPFYTCPYWTVDGIDGIPDQSDFPSDAYIAEVSKLIDAPFFAADFLQKEDGSFVLGEVNDGGSAGIPANGDAKDFYTALAKQCLI